MYIEETADELVTRGYCYWDSKEYPNTDLKLSSHPFLAVYPLMSILLLRQ